jgi:hypothetical protein
MARGTVTVNDIVLGGLSYPAGVNASSEGLLFQNDGKTAILLTNTGTAASTATFVTPGQIGGLNIEDKAVVLPGSSTAFFGPFPISQFNNLDNTAYIEFNGTANVQARGFRLP